MPKKIKLEQETQKKCADILKSLFTFLDMAFYIFKFANVSTVLF